MSHAYALSNITVFVCIPLGVVFCILALERPHVIMLDEPTSGLDPKQLVEIRKIITNLGKDKIVIVSSHVIQEIEEICNRIIILNKGEILADKKISDFDGNLANKFLKLIDT